MLTDSRTPKSEIFTTITVSDKRPSWIVPIADGAAFDYAVEDARMQMNAWPCGERRWVVFHYGSNTKVRFALAISLGQSLMLICTALSL